MKARKLLSVVLAFVMVMSLLPMSAMGAEFDDTKGHWAEASINRWSDAGVLNGSGGGFNPNGSMTRAEAAQVFTNLLGLKSTEGAQTFSDVPANAWYADAIAKANAAGIMGGVGDGQMNPDGTVSREMFFTMFARALGIKPQETTKGVAADGNSWSAGYINALTDKGFVKGSGSGVDALATMNRASMAALLDQTVSTYANEPGATVTGSGEGVVLVVADNVTVTGSVDTLVVAEGAQDESGAAGVTLQDAAVGSLNVVAKAEVALEGATSVETVAVAAAAEGASVSVGADAKVETVEVAAADTTLAVSGTVGAVAVAETATGAAVATTSTAKIDSVTTEAANTAVTGTGTVAAVEATGSAAGETTVSTPNTAITEVKTTENADGSTTKETTTSTNTATGAAGAATTTTETTAADGTTGNTGSTGSTGTPAPTPSATTNTGSGGSEPIVSYYTISYNANGGTGTIESQTVQAGTSATIKANSFTYEDKTFVGWNTAADGSGTGYAPNASYVAEAGLTLYAIWRSDNAVAVSFRAVDSTTAATTPYGVEISAYSDGDYTVAASGNGASVSGTAQFITTGHSAFANNTTYKTIGHYAAYQIVLGDSWDATTYANATMTINATDAPSPVKVTDALDASNGKVITVIQRMNDLWAAGNDTVTITFDWDGSGASAIPTDTYSIDLSGVTAGGSLAANSFALTSENTKNSALTIKGDLNIASGSVTLTGVTLTVTGDVTIGAGASLTVGEGVTLTVPAGKTLKVESSGTITNDGTITVNGTVETAVSPAGSGGVWNIENGGTFKATAGAANTLVGGTMNFKPGAKGYLYENQFYIGGSTDSDAFYKLISGVITLKPISAEANMIVGDGNVATAVTVNKNAAILAGQIAEVSANATLTIATGVTLTNLGTVTLEGTIDNNGAFDNEHGTLTNTSGKFINTKADGTAEGKFYGPGTVTGKGIVLGTMYTATGSKTTNASAGMAWWNAIRKGSVDSWTIGDDEPVYYTAAVLPETASYVRINVGTAGYQKTDNSAGSTKYSVVRWSTDQNSAGNWYKQSTMDGDKWETNSAAFYTAVQAVENVTIGIYNTSSELISETVTFANKDHSGAGD